MRANSKTQGHSNAVSDFLDTTAGGGPCLAPLPAAQNLPPSPAARDASPVMLRPPSHDNPTSCVCCPGTSQGNDDDMAALVAQLEQVAPRCRQALAQHMPCCPTLSLSLSHTHTEPPRPFLPAQIPPRPPTPARARARPSDGGGTQPLQPFCLPVTVCSGLRLGTSWSSTTRLIRSQKPQRPCRCAETLPHKGLRDIEAYPRTLVSG